MLRTHEAPHKKCILYAQYLRCYNHLFLKDGVRFENFGLESLLKMEPQQPEIIYPRPVVSQTCHLWVRRGDLPNPRIYGEGLLIIWKDDKAGH